MLSLGHAELGQFRIWLEAIDEPRDERKQEPVIDDHLRHPGAPSTVRRGKNDSKIDVATVKTS